MLCEFDGKQKKVFLQEVQDIFRLVDFLLLAVIIFMTKDKTFTSILLIFL